MDNSSDIEHQIVHDIHGERVGEGKNIRCDFCDNSISINQPMMYDVVNAHDMPNLNSLGSLPDGWYLDAVRCQGCEIENVNPKTEGWEEAIIMLNVTESDGLLVADGNSLVIVDYSKSNEGNYPPPLQPQFFNRFGASLSRWAFLKSHFENTDDVSPVSMFYRDMVNDLK